MSRFNGRAVAEQISENAERVRRVIPPEVRAERTAVVYDLALFMTEVTVQEQDIPFAFTLMAWARENA